MNPSRFLLAVVTLALAFLFIIAAPDAMAGKPKPAPPVDKRKLIKSVDLKASTIEIEFMRDKKSQTYKVDEITAITVNNVKGTIAQVKAGMKVGDYVERDGQTLDSISVTGYGTTDEPKKKKK